MKHPYWKTRELGCFTHRQSIKAKQGDGEFKAYLFDCHARAFEDLDRDFQRQRSGLDETLAPERLVFNINSMGVILHTSADFALAFALPLFRSPRSSFHLSSLKRPEGLFAETGADMVFELFFQQGDEVRSRRGEVL